MSISAESDVKQHVVILQLRDDLPACEVPFRKGEWTLRRSSAKGNLHLHQLRADACAFRPHIQVAERRIRVLGQQRISVRTNLHRVGKEFQLRRGKKRIKTSVYKGYKQDKIEMRGDRAEMSDFPLYLNTVAGGLDRRDQTIGGFSFVVKIYAVPVVEIIGQLLYLLGRYGFNTQFGDCL